MINNELFNIYKFRLMKIDIFNVVIDLMDLILYIIKIGKVICKIFIDELL